MKILFSSHTDNPCISFGYAGKKFAEQLARLVDVEVVHACEPAKGDLHIHLGQPAGKANPDAQGWEFLRFPRKAPRFIAYSVCESTIIDPGWITQFNECEAVFTASRFCHDVFRANGVKVPIFIIPHGVDPEDFPYMDRPQGRKPYTYFWQGTSFLSDRKCGHMVEKVFNELNLPDARLLIKSVPWPGGEIHWRAGRVHQIASWSTLTGVRELHYEADCFVWPTRGEGFGMIPLEVMSTGLPVICTDWSGPRDYLSDSLAFPLRKFRMQTSIYGPEWGEDAGVDLEELKARMLWCYEHREEAREIGRTASFYVQKVWRWDGRVYDALRRALVALRIPLKESHVSTQAQAIAG